MWFKKNYIANKKIAFVLLLFIIIQSCNNDTSHLFTLLSSSQTGIHFKNILKEDTSANVLNYTYF
ncbi:MAG: hypothetical protein ABJA35_01360, partial [Parafilimonas sp.]